MAIREQKLFFTRNGEYSLWEQLSYLKEDQLEELLTYVFEKQWVDTAPGLIEEYPWYFYSTYQKLEKDEYRELLATKIYGFFSELPEPPNDFNALLFHINAAMLDLESANQQLQELQRVNFEIEELNIKLFLHPEINAIDVRFTSPLISRYKESQLQQIINTEIRVYLSFNTALVTNYSNYTHSDKAKEKFIVETVARVSSHRGEIKPLKFSDALMRKLLHTGKQQTSKLKFELEDRLKVAIEINQSSTLQDVIKHDEIKYFYTKGSLALLKVELADDPNKALIIDVEGKLICRNQNLFPEDIDDFIDDLNPLLKFDYLNKDYKGLFKQLAFRNLDGLSFQKELNITNSITVIDSIIQEQCRDESETFPRVIFNMFMYCMVHKVFLDDVGAISVSFPEKELRYLARIGNVPKETVIALINTLLNYYLRSNNQLEVLMQQFDREVSEYQRMIENASGA